MSRLTQHYFASVIDPARGNRDPFGNRCHDGCSKTLHDMANCSGNDWKNDQNAKSAVQK